MSSKISKPDLLLMDRLSDGELLGWAGIESGSEAELGRLLSKRGDSEMPGVFVP